MTNIIKFSLFILLFFYCCEKEEILDPNDPMNHIFWDNCNEFTGEELATNSLYYYTPSTNFPNVTLEIGIDNGESDTFELKLNSDRYELTLISSYPTISGQSKLNFQDTGVFTYEEGDIYISPESGSLIAQNTVQFKSDDGWESPKIKTIQHCVTHLLPYRRSITDIDSVSVRFHQVN